MSRAVAYFKEGFNCSQAVVLAYADLYDLSPEVAAKVSASFGGGIGRLRETCGAACGMFVLAGLEKGTDDAADAQAKLANYKFVQELAAEFKERNGALACAELLELRKNGDVKNRTCAQVVEEAARIIGERVMKK